ncbi:MAG: peptide-methionine (S)-S-oxide reductase, partial [Cellvibrionaceae bacterium]
KEKMPTQQQVLPGREDAILITNEHAVLKTPLQPPYPNGNEQIVLGLGCFWGAEKAFWQLPGVYTTAVGYSAGFTPNPTYEEVCSGLTGHNEVVLVVFDPQVVAVEQILQSFWQSHNPTQGMRQGGDRGTQYRSGIYCFNGHQQQLAEQTKNQYQATIARQMGDKGPSITTEITSAGVFYFAEDYHQQYLAKNPNGYCGLGGMGIDF